MQGEQLASSGKDVGQLSTALAATIREHAEAAAAVLALQAANNGLQVGAVFTHRCHLHACRFSGT